MVDLSECPAEVIEEAENLAQVGVHISKDEAPVPKNGDVPVNRDVEEERGFATHQLVMSKKSDGSDPYKRTVADIGTDEMINMLRSALTHETLRNIRKWVRLTSSYHKTALDGVNELTAEMIKAPKVTRKRLDRQEFGDLREYASRKRRRVEMPTVKCVMCMDDVPGTACENGHGACAGCLDQYVPTVSAEEIPCPVPDCKHTLSSSMVNPFVVQAMKDRHEEISRKVALNEGAVGQVFCSCGRVSVVTEFGDGTVTCVCGIPWCIKCNSIVHPGELCTPGTFDVRNTKKWVKGNAHARICPKCGDAVERSGGCNHYTHSKPSGGCGHHFCWVCLEPWGRCDYDGCYRDMSPSQQLERDREMDSDQEDSDEEDSDEESD